MEICVKKVTAVTEELREAFGRLLPQLSPTLSAPSAGQLLTILENPTTVLFAAYAAERVVGVLTLTWYDVPSGRKAWVEDVVVDAAVRGCGAGEVLVAAAVAHASQIGAGRVMLTSSPGRSAARGLYRKMGFEEAETSVFVRKMDK